MGTKELKDELIALQQKMNSLFDEVESLSAPKTTTIELVDDTLTIDDLVTAAHDTAVDKGWWEGERSIPECLALIHAEVSEALEEYRDGSISWSIDGTKPVGFATELADVCIRVFDLAGKLGIPLGEVIQAKMEYNATRPHRHGGKKA